MKTIWQQDASFENHEPLRGDVRTDVLVIGGGITGILCAYMLRRSGVDCVLVEADRLFSGTSGGTTAKITSQHGLVYSKLLKRFGAEKAQMYLRSNEEGLRTYVKLCADIDCSFERRDSYVYSRNNRAVLEDEMTALDVIGFRAHLSESVPLPVETVGAVKFADQAQFDPVRFAAHISRGLRIYERTQVRELIGCTAKTDAGSIRASNIIVATHFPFINKHGSYFLKLYQHRSYVMALEGAPDVGGMYVDEAKDGLSFRHYNGMLLLGGGSHRTGKQGGGWNELARFAAQHYPGAKEKFRWAAQDCMSLDDMPYIGRYSASTHNLYVATGFNKWGMTSAMTAATLLCDMLTGRDNEYAWLYSPSRSMMHAQLAANGFEAAANLLTPTVKRCPHLGCALKWNAQEHSWDCPCHGSRFSQDGKLLDNPATGDLKNAD